VRLKVGEISDWFIVRKAAEGRAVQYLAETPARRDSRKSRLWRESASGPPLCRALSASMALPFSRHPLLIATGNNQRPI
jgi:hypothetical protein